MSKVLIVDDSKTQLAQIQYLMESEGHETATALDGKQAMNSIGESDYSVVLTDLHMPEMNGLELVRTLKQERPGLPVLLMTADGSEEIAVEALKSGAASYLPKASLVQDLVRIVDEILQSERARQQEEKGFGALQSSVTNFVLSHDLTLIPGVVAMIENDIARVCRLDESTLLRMTTAYREALVNAIEHGNLELDSALREGDGQAYHELGNARRHLEPYKSREVNVMSSISRDEIRITIEDEGPGFDPSVIPDPTDPENLIRASGRGLMLIQTFMDDVAHNERGNMITLVKKIGG